MKKIRVLLADDHAIVIDGLKAVLEGVENIRVVGEAANGNEVLDRVEKIGGIDVIVMDINMPEMNGLTCARKVKQLYPHIKIIVLTMYAQQVFIQEIIKLGIDGCLLKNNSGKELTIAIQRVAEDKYYYDRIKTLDTPSTGKDIRFGPREVEIIKLLAEGLTSTDIAHRLFISEHTVKTHRKNILRKTNLHNTADLVQYALNRGMI